MRTRMTSLVCSAAIALGIVAGTAVASGANGAEFFEAENDGKVVLYYFGQIKDGKGAPLDKLMITVKAKNVDMSFPIRNDSPGHFRTSDIGRAIEGLGKKVDLSQIEISVTKAGYKIVSSPKIPNKMGAVQLDAFVLDAVK